MTTLLRAELHLVPIFGPFLSPLKLQPTRFAHTWRITILSFRHSTHAHRVRRNPKLKKRTPQVTAQIRAIRPQSNIYVARPLQNRLPNELCQSRGDPQT